MNKQFDLTSRKIDNFINLGFNLYQYYKDNDFKPNNDDINTKFNKDGKKTQHLLILDEVFKQIYKEHEEFKKNLRELKIKFTKVDNDNFPLAFKQDGRFRYFLVIEIVNLDIFKQIYKNSIANGKTTISIGDICQLFYMWSSHFKTTVLSTLAIKKPLIRKVIYGETCEFNECSVCLEVIKKKVQFCPTCSNITCEVCHKKLICCPICRSSN
jgi:hypothetical protein